MMLYPSMAELLEKIDSRYLLVNVIAKRAREISAEAEETQDYLEEKSVSIAIREIADGKISVVSGGDAAKAEEETEEAEASPEAEDEQESETEDGE